MSDTVKMGKVIPLKGKDEQGRPVFSGNFDFHSKATYLRLAGYFGEDVAIGKETASIMPTTDVILSNIEDKLERMLGEIREMRSPTQEEASPIPIEVIYPEVPE